MLPIGRGQRELIVGDVKQVKHYCFGYYLNQKYINEEDTKFSAFMWYRAKKKFYFEFQSVLEKHNALHYTP